MARFRRRPRRITPWLGGGFRLPESLSPPMRYDRAFNSWGTRLTGLADLFSLRPLVFRPAVWRLISPIGTNLDRRLTRKPTGAEKQLHPTKALMSAHPIRERPAVARVLKSPQAWAELRRRAALRLLRMHYESRAGHIGGNLSSLDLLLVVHHEILDSRDQFILSKGHAAGAFYVTLWTMGRLEDGDLCLFHGDDTRLSGHPPASGIDDVLFATGSLGHGVSLGAGLALAKRLKSEPGRIFCLTSDGEWNEGSCWEALIFVRQHSLANLTIVVDHNGLQGFGTTREVASLEPIAEKFQAFGFSTEEIDGHDALAIRRALNHEHTGPHAIVAHTQKGCGVSFMEDRMEWHYLPMTESQYLQAVQEIEQKCGTPYARPWLRPLVAQSLSS
jgi:transketolase